MLALGQKPRWVVCHLKVAQFESNPSRNEDGGMSKPNFISLPSGRIIDVDKIASVAPAKESPPGIRFSFGAQFNEMDAADATVVLDALDARGADTTELRKKAGLAARR